MEIVVLVIILLLTPVDTKLIFDLHFVQRKTNLVSTLKYQYLRESYYDTAILFIFSTLPSGGEQSMCREIFSQSDVYSVSKLNNRSVLPLQYKA